MITATGALWFFKRITINPDYIICSDKTIYSAKRKNTIIVKPWMGRQKYTRVRLCNGKQLIKSVSSLHAMMFPRRKAQFIPTQDCPF